jgi:hydroxymethylglutaryl-CoA lyase
MTMTLVDVSPRDGLQNEERALSVGTRVELVGRLVEAGLTRIEVAAFVRPDRVPQMAGAEEVIEALPRGAASYSGLVLNERGLERALATALDEVTVVVPCTDEMSMRNQGTDVQGMLGQASRIVEAARSAGVPATVTAAVAFGCPFSGEVAEDAVRSVVVAAAEAGASEICIADTIGVGVPSQVHRLAEIVREEARGLSLRFHFHNTRNTGYANAVAACDSGADALDASVGGFGGCPFAPGATGNIATEDLAYLLRRGGWPGELDLERLCATASWLGERLGRSIPALIGRAGDFPPASTDSPRPSRVLS